MRKEPKSTTENAQSISLDFPVDQVLSDVLSKAGYSFALPCGGRGSCGKCKALVSGALHPPSEKEQRLLTSAELESGMRLLCQARSCGGVVTFHSLPDHSLVSILVEDYTGAASNGTCSESDCLERVQFELSSYETRSEWEGLKQPVQRKPSLRTLKGLATAIPNGEREAAFWGGELVAMRPPGHNGYYGIACDLGTTTVVVYLVDLITGVIVDALSVVNPQVIHGSDVMSRIAYASSPDGLKRLQTAITNTISELIAKVTVKNNIQQADVVLCTAVGNTCMQHLFLGISPVSLGQAPYLPVWRESMLCSGSELGLSGLSNALVWTGPAIGGFVGSDAVAAAVSGRLRQDEQPRLLLDLGTNGELLLAANGKVLACSAAAGPAFEGLNISCGMLAQPGAIDKVSITPDAVKIHVIGETGAPKGICGSGLVDTVAALLEVGLVDETGRLLAPDEAKHLVATPVLDRLIDTRNGLMFRLDSRENKGSPVGITQKDLRQVQAAKGAIKAAYEILCEEMGLETTDLAEVLLAGGFGNYVQPENAIRIGLLPSVPPSKIRSIGNAAGAGAILALLSQESRSDIDSLARQAQPIELNLHTGFQERFIDAMFFV